MKKIIWFIAFLPLLYIVYRLGFEIDYLDVVSEFIYSNGGSFLGDFPNDPQKFMADLLGITAIQFLIASLSITPLKSYLKINLMKYRRLIGLWAFAYAFIHSMFFFIVDNELNFSLMYDDMMKRQFVFFGVSAFLILLFMALTSFKKLFSKFVKWHKLVYVAAVLISLHFLMSQKIIGFDVSMYVIVISILLVLRLLKR